jgi:type IV secretory pathway TraG/TraD family ATPase VirD4
LSNPKAFKKWAAWKSGFRMASWMSFYLFLFILAVYLAITLFVNYLIYQETWKDITEYSRAVVEARNLLLLYDAAEVMADLVFVEGRYIFVLTAPIWFLFFYIIYRLKKGSAKMYEPEYVAGAYLKTPRAIMKEMKKKGDKGRIPIGPILKIPIDKEIRHIGLFGITGAGKSTFLKDALSTLRREIKNGGKGIIYDPLGEFVSSFYRKGIDKIFNPLDTRGIKYSIFNDIRYVIDINSICATLIPDPAGKQDPYWQISARQLLAGILHYCFLNNWRTNRALWNFLTLPRKELYKLLSQCSGTKMAALQIEEEGKRSDSVLSVARSYASLFEYMTEEDDGFSIRKWITDEEQYGWIFVTNMEEAKETLKPMLTLFFDLATTAMKSLSIDPSRRIYVFLDEFATLHKMKNLLSLLTEGRKFGASTFLGGQDIGSIDEIYSRNLREKILNALGNMLVFQLKSVDTAGYFSEYIGRQLRKEITDQTSW